MDKTVIKSLRAFEHLCREETPLGVTELAAKLKLTKTNAHRIVKTLSHLGYLAQDENERYFPTLKACELGGLVAGRLNFMRVAKEHLKELNRATNESVYLATLNGLSIFYLDVLESSHPIRLNAAIGGSAPAHCTASGKILLAYNPKVAEQYMRRPLTRFTSQTIVAHARLAQELERVRKAGHATVVGEWLEGLCGAAAPIHSSIQQGVAAIGVTAPRERVHQASLKQLASVVSDAARQISEKLGYIAPRR